jgi:uncharacterized membrane protein
MPFCSNCGSPVEGSFCAKCGTPIGAQVSGGPPPAQASASSGLTENVAGALCYVLGFITGIIFLVLAPYSQNKAIRFHAFQSIFLSVAWFAIWVVIGVVLPWSLYFTLTPLLSLAGLVLWIFLMWKTYQNQKVVLPVVGPIAEKQA